MEVDNYTNKSHGGTRKREWQFILIVGGTAQLQFQGQLNRYIHHPAFHGEYYQSNPEHQSQLQVLEVDLGRNPERRNHERKAMTIRLLLPSNAHASLPAQISHSHILVSCSALWPQDEAVPAGPNQFCSVKDKKNSVAFTSLSIVTCTDQYPRKKKNSCQMFSIISPTFFIKSKVEEI